MELIQYQLDNGLQVILHPVDAAPVVACQVWVGVGSADEEPHEAGLAHVHEHMLFKGTARRKVGELAREVEAAGGHINAFTSFDETCYYVVMSSRFLDRGLDILADAIRNSSFEADELGRELEVIQEEIKRGNDQPARVATQTLFQTAFVEHPYRLPIIGTKESVDSFTRDHVTTFFRKHYVPDNMTVVLVGDFEEEGARTLIEKEFGDFAPGDYSRAPRPIEPAQAGFRGKIASTDTAESHLRIAFPIPNVEDEDIPALQLLAGVMSYGEASHLVRTLQRDRKLVKSIFAAPYTPRDAGLFFVSSTYQLEDGLTHDDVVRPIFEEVFRFREVIAAQPEVERARTLIVSQEVYGKETVEGLANTFGRSMSSAGDPLFNAKLYERLAHVTAEDIQAVARKYLAPERATLVLLHPENGPTLSENGARTLAEDALEKVSARAVDAGISLDESGFARVEIPDGPTLVLQQSNAVEAFAIRLLVHGGLRFESRLDNGIHHLLSQAGVCATQKRDAVSLAREVESMAASIYGMSGRNSFGVSMYGLARDFERCFDIFQDVIHQSDFPDDELSVEKSLQIQSIASRRDHLGAVCFDLFARAFFGDHPYSLPLEGTVDTVSSFERPRLKERWAELMSDADAAMVVVGDIDPQVVVANVERHFAGRMKEKKQKELPALPQRQRPVLVTDSLEKEQAFITVGFDAPTIESHERYAMELFHAVASGMGGRLFYELRDRQSLAYSVYASMVLGMEASAFTVNIGTSPEKIHQAIKGIFEELEKMRQGVTAEEVARAKTYLIGNHDIGLQRNNSRAMSFGLDELYGFGYERTLQYADRISSVSVDDINAFAQTWLAPGKSVVAVVKPAAMEVDPEVLPE